MSRLGGILLAIAVLGAGAYGLLQLANSRDSADVATPAAGGVGEPAPTPCPDARANVTRDGATLGDDELATALSQGNVVMQSSSQDSLQRLGRLQETVSGAFDPELAAAGQMVIRARGGTEGVTALAWGRRLGPVGAEDPQLREFADAYLGKGAPADLDCG